MNLQGTDFFFETAGKQRDVGPRPAADGLDQGRLQFRQAVPAIGLDGNHGNAQPALQMPQFQLDAATGGHVEHVHRHDGGQPQFQDLADQVQMPFEVRAVDDAEHDVDRPNVGLPLQEHLDGHHFVARSGRKAIESRQIDHFEPPPRMLHPAGLLFDRHARIVADMLMDSDQRAEERRFARVRIADQGNRQRRFLDGGRHVILLTQDVNMIAKPPTESVRSSSCAVRSGERQSIAQQDRHDGNAQSIVGPKTDLVAGHANNARISRPEHLDAGSAPQTKLL